MAKTRKKVNVVTVGVGFLGGLVLAECTKAGLSGGGLERGDRRGINDFQEMHDEWRYAVNYAFMQDLSKETVTFRNTEAMQALPMRRMGSFLLGDGLGVCYDDFNADNFNHEKLDFIHGGVISLTQTGKRPIESNSTPSGTPSWGSAFKKASIHNFNRSLSIGAQGASMPYKYNYLSLDDTYRDAYGLPLLRMTYNFTDQDRALFRFIAGKIEEAARAMNPKAMDSKASPRDYNIVPYQTTHNTGGTITGKSPEDSVVNSYLQHWDVKNLFVVGAGNFPHNGGCNPTGTAGALGFRCAEGILKYAQKGGSLV